MGSRANVAYHSRNGSLANGATGPYTSFSSEDKMILFSSGSEASENGSENSDLLIKMEDLCDERRDGNSTFKIQFHEMEMESNSTQNCELKCRKLGSTFQFSFCGIPFHGNWSWHWNWS
jgi:hypothetical protein